MLNVPFVLPRLPTPLQYGLNKLMDKIREGILKHPNRELIKAKFSEYDYGKRIRDNIRGMIGLDGYKYVCSW